MVLITQLIGSGKKYQWWIFFLCINCKFSIAYHQMAILFLAPPVTYTCPNNATCCDNPVYNTSIFTRTIITEWHLICDRAWLVSLSQTLFQLGVMLGSVGFGIMSDRYGRRPALIYCVILELSSGLIATAMPEYWSFTFVRMLIGASIGGVMVVAFVILMEFVGDDKRTTFSGLFHAPFTMGHMLLALYGYFIRDFIHLQLFISLVNVYLLLLICLLPESARWFLAVNKTSEAIALLTKIAKINKMPTDEIQATVEKYQAARSGDPKCGSAADLFRTPNLRRNILIMSFIWFGCSFCFYGMSMYITHLTGNIFVNVAASGTVCFISCFISIPIMWHMKRKSALMLGNGVCGFCLLIIGFIPEGILSVLLACAGVLACFVAFIVVYLYSSEMFPTVVRNAALGISSMTARVGAMIAPFVVSLKVYGQWLAPVAFGVVPLIGALACLMLPETKGKALITTLEEGEALGRKITDSSPRVQTVTNT